MGETGVPHAQGAWFSGHRGGQNWYLFGLFLGRFSVHYSWSFFFDFVFISDGPRVSKLSSRLDAVRERIILKWCVMGRFRGRRAELFELYWVSFSVFFGVVFSVCFRLPLVWSRGGFLRHFGVILGAFWGLAECFLG